MLSCSSLSVPSASMLTGTFCRFSVTFCAVTVDLLERGRLGLVRGIRGGQPPASIGGDRRGQRQSAQH